MGLFDKLKQMVEHTKGALESKPAEQESPQPVVQETGGYSRDELDNPPEYVFTQALYAVVRNDIETVRKYLAFNTNYARCRDWDDNTLLHKAAQCARTDIVRILLEHQADINSLFHNKTPLHAAVATDELWVKANLNEAYATYQPRRRDTLRTLLDAGASLQHFDEHGESPLHTAARLGLGGVVQLLLEHGADINQLTQSADDSAYAGRSPLLLVAKHSKNIKMMEFLLKQRADPNIQDETPGFSALHYLAATPYFEDQNKEKLLAMSTLLLLTYHANPDLPAKGKRGQTPLHLASANNHLDMVETLLTKGANMASKTDSGHTAVELAAQKGHIPIVSYFLKRGIDPYATRLLFHAAAYKKSTQLMELLLDSGMDVNQPDPQGYTPLFAAVLANSLRNVEFLLQHSADANLHPPGLTLSQHAFSNWGAIEALPEEQKVEADKNAQGIIKLLGEVTKKKKKPPTDLSMQENADAEKPITKSIYHTNADGSSLSFMPEEEFTEETK